jgi:hypothetical protein
MAFVYEVNGQKVEFENEPSDADIDEAARSLGAPPAPAEAAQPGGEDLAASAAQTALSAGMSVGPTGLKELGQAGVQAVKPFAQAAAGPTAAAYRAYPLIAPAVDAVGLATMGVPPVAASQSAMGLYDKYKGAVEGAKEVSKFTSQGAPTTGPTGSVYPETVPGFREMQKANPAVAQKLSEVYQTGGGNNAVKAWLSGPEGQAAMRDPRFAAAAESYMGKVPGVMGQVGRVVGPVARGAAKALGPVGMGMNLYDAGQMARETQLGERLAQGQGRMAENAFRGGMNMSYQGPQLAPQEAQNVLQSGSARDIKYFGGEDQLKQMIRKKAAEKVFGPVAPGSF